MLRIDLTGSDPGNEIVLRGGHELLFHQVHDIHLGEDGGDQSVDLQGCRLMAGCLTDHHGLHELTHDWHQATLGMFVSVPTCHCHEIAHPDCCLLRIMASAEVFNLREHIGLGGVELCNHLCKRKPVVLKLVERVIQCQQSRPTLDCPVCDLLDDVLLLALQ
ncbi:hypothetical protein [Rhizobium sp. 18065]|uniref:hypothetical protein n=1 Tax=Rhizobium sp. 18065 TaxID=2681411 RepID=UPI00135CA8BB|nr:hypothetical protein [Rhizobium sp. 18065]